MRRLLPLALCALLHTAGAAQAAPPGLDDLLRTEELGAVGFDPTGRVLVIERRRAYDQAPAFDTEAELTIGRTDLLIADLRRSGAPRLLLPRLPAGGYAAGPISPDGARMLVYRLNGTNWDAGVVSLATGKVGWLGLTPELPGIGRAAQWRSPTELLLTVRPPGDLPPALRIGRQGPARTWARTRQSASGRTAAATVLISGAASPSAPAKTLLRLDLRRGTSQVLLRAEIEDFELSPDGRQVAVLRLAEAAPPREPLWRVAEPTRTRRLDLVDLARGQPRSPCPERDLAPLLLAWSPDSRALLAYGRGPGQTWAQGRLLRIDAAGAAPTPVQPPLRRSSEGLPYVVASWDGASPRLAGAPDEVAPPALGDGYRQRLAPRPSDPGAPPTPEATLVAQRAGLRVWRGLDDRGVQALVLTRPASRPRSLLVLNAALAARTPPQRLALAHAGPAGQRLTSWLYLPDPAASPAPLVVIPYPGVVRDRPPPPYGDGAAGLQTNAWALTALGYAVLLPSLPRDPASAEPAAGLAETIDHAVDAALATGRIDARRLALFGHSFGGYAALMTAARSPRFRAVIAKAAATDLAALHDGIIPHYATVPEDGALGLTFGPGWAEAGQGHLLARPVDAMARYRRNSPLALSDQIRAPVLLIAGDQDEVPIQQSQALFQAFYREGHRAELLTYAGERHLIASPANLRDLYRRLDGWLQAAFAGAAPPGSAAIADGPT